MGPAIASRAPILYLSRQQARSLAAIAVVHTRADAAALLAISRHTLNRHLAAAYERMDADPDSRVVIDSGLRGRELIDAIGKVTRRRLQVFEAKAETRRYEVAGRLSLAIETGQAKIKRSLFDPALRQALSAVTREDAGDMPEIVALSLALIDRRPPRPQIL